MTFLPVGPKPARRHADGPTRFAALRAACRPEGRRSEPYKEEPRGRMAPGFPLDC